MKLAIATPNFEDLNATINSHSGSYYRSWRRLLYPPPYGPPPQYPPTRPTRPTVPPPAMGRLKVAIASQGQGGLDDVVSPMFGRCPTFTIVDIENGEIKGVDAVPNQAAHAMHGAGIAAVQTLANLGVNAILAGRFGPNASAVCNQSGIQMIPVQPGTKIRDAVQSFISGKLRTVSAPTAPMHTGTGFFPGMPGMGIGRRGGGGRGRGRMGGFGLGPSGFCVCPSCGFRSPHVMGTPCFRQTCPQCGSRMTRER